MNFLNKLSITTKHFILLSVMAMGFVSITAISYHSMGAIKKRLDIVYFGNIIPASQLMTISDMYNKNILNTLHQYQNSIIGPESARSNINDAKDVIYDSWHEYTSKYHTQTEKEINDYAQRQIKESVKIIDLLIYFFDQNDKNSIEKSVKYELYPKIVPVIEIIDKLIAYEFSLAAHEKKVANTTYTNTISVLLFALAVIFFLAIIIFFPILKNIKHNDTMLRGLNEKLTTISITDPLTQIYNRRYFDIIMPQEIQRTRRKKETLCFAMIDIDYFKLYNDHYGHQAGDEALKSVAQAINSSLKRAGDYSFRLGGEEFGVVVSDLNEEDAMNFFERIRNAVKDLEIAHVKNPYSILTISSGVTFIKSDGTMDMQTIIKKSDDSLYEAKENGRDNVVFKKNINSDLVA